jgi:ubiquinone/menaquinone biosynthesis C-methylase UbiE
MAQNIYDDPAFFSNYTQLDRQVRGLDGAPEWPRLRSFLPEIAGTSILDLGCGFGWFARWAREHGAVLVTGIDISQNMLDTARKMTAEEDAKEGGGSPRGTIAYQQADLESLKLPDEAAQSYDLVFSSLALHYLEHLPELMTEVHRVLKPGGKFVFNVEHPIYTAPSKPSIVIEPETDRWYWPLDDYQVEGLRTTNWLAEGVRKQHRTMATYINLLLRQGFELTHLDEWCPTQADLERKPKWKSNIVRPTFLLVAAAKK